MATTAEIMVRKIEELSASIGSDSKGSQILSPAPSISSNILAVFQLNNKKVTFSLDKNNQIEVLLEHGNKKIVIPRVDIDGIPKECFDDPHKMRAFLSESHVGISEYLDNKGIKIKVNLKLLGGGNTGVVGNGPGEIKLWGKKDNKVIIPYFIEASNDVATLWNQGVRASQDSRIQAEFNNAQSIFEAIKRWNTTTLVQLLNTNNLIATSEYEQAFGHNHPGHWIKFSTILKKTLCKASCIGMCDNIQEQPVTCDLTNEFKDTPVQSIMHEIGHVIGLRHEHARADRDSYVDTNFPERGGNLNGSYDFDSVMHYGFDNYPNNEYLRKKNPMPLYGYTKKISDNQVGKNPTISLGDIAAVKKLYNIW